KLGVLRLVTMAADEARGTGITVNCVVPSIVDTPANRAAMPDADHDSWPKVEDVARAYLFLASPEAHLVSGAAIPVQAYCTKKRSASVRAARRSGPGRLRDGRGAGGPRRPGQVTAWVPGRRRRLMARMNAVARAIISPGAPAGTSTRTRPAPGIPGR